MARISINSLQKRFGAVEVLKDISLDVADGEFVALVGPSGCGKSTLLRTIAGIEEATSGSITIGNQRVDDLPPRERNVAMVFQDYALYPHMTVAENIGFGLMIRKVPPAERDAKVLKAATILQIDHLLDRRPKDLSGGQRQRVAMGRCLVREPQAFLYDEPLSNLDASLRVSMRMQIKLLHAQMGVTSIYVTHDQVEAMTMADRIVCMRGGVIAQAGSPTELYQRPVNRFVAGFIGSPGMNFVPGTITQRGDTTYLSVTPDMEIPLLGRLQHIRKADNSQAVLGIRPEHLTDIPHGVDGNERFPLELPVLTTEPLGADTLVHVLIAGGTAIARCSPGVKAAPNSKLRLYADLHQAHLFSALEQGTSLSID